MLLWQRFLQHPLLMPVEPAWGSSGPSIRSWQEPSSPWKGMAAPLWED